MVTNKLARVVPIEQRNKVMKEIDSKYITLLWYFNTTIFYNKLEKIWLLNKKILIK